MAVSGNGSPVYSIVIPDEYAKGEVEKKFGHIGVITPKNISSKEAIDYACSGLNTNLTDPMFGYVEWNLKVYLTVMAIEWEAILSKSS